AAPWSAGWPCATSATPRRWRTSRSGSTGPAWSGPSPLRAPIPATTCASALRPSSGGPPPIAGASGERCDGRVTPLDDGAEAAARAARGPRERPAGAKRVVVKLGTSSLTSETGVPDRDRMRRIAGQVLALRGRGVEVVVVSSGAIAAGLAALGLERRPNDQPPPPAPAAVRDRGPTG